MCLSWLFGNKVKPPAWEHSPRVALLFGINNYGGFGQDLNGCINDVELAASRLNGFQIRKFLDKQVTVRNFINQVEYAIANSVENDVIYIHYSGHGTYVEDLSGDELDGYDEALYLYDGPLIDDKMNEMLQKIPEGVTVLLLLDSCFSGTATRNPYRIRFMPPTFEKVSHLRVKRNWYENMKWVVLSGCGENQTSADAEFDGKSYGAFTYFAWHTLKATMTYKTWHAKIREFLPSREFDQAPTLEGNSMLLEKRVFT